MTALHDAAVKQGAMQQLLLWLGFIEIFGFVAIVQMLQGSDRQPGDFGFDPLNCAKNPNVTHRSSMSHVLISLQALARRQLVELKNGRLAMVSLKEGGGIEEDVTRLSRLPPLVCFTTTSSPARAPSSSSLDKY